MVGFIVRAAMVALGLWLASQIFSGLHFEAANILIAAALLLGVVNAIVRPILLILTLPITVVTLGFFLLVINAAMLGLVALILDGFRIANFWTALGASLIVSLTSWLASSAIGNNGRIEVYRSERERR